jgi:hypothetical protein
MRCSRASAAPAPTAQAIIAKLMTEEPRPVALRRATPSYVEEAPNARFRNCPPIATERRASSLTRFKEGCDVNRVPRPARLLASHGGTR